MNHSEYLPSDSSESVVSMLDISRSLSASERKEVFESALKMVLPHVGTHPDQIVLAQVLITLKLEGILSDELLASDFDMVRVVKDAFLKDPIRVNDAVKMARKLLK